MATAVAVAVAVEMVAAAAVNCSTRCEDCTAVSGRAVTVPTVGMEVAMDMVSLMQSKAARRFHHKPGLIRIKITK